MEREQHLYNNIMQDISKLKQNQPLSYNIKDFICFYVCTLEELFTAKGKVVLLGVIILGLSIGLANPNDTNIVANNYQENSLYAIAYNIDISY